MITFHKIDFTDLLFKASDVRCEVVTPYMPGGFAALFYHPTNKSIAIIQEYRLINLIERENDCDRDKALELYLPNIKALCEREFMPESLQGYRLAYLGHFSCNGAGFIKDKRMALEFPNMTFIIRYQEPNLPKGFVSHVDRLSRQQFKVSMDFQINEDLPALRLAPPQL